MRSARFWRTSPPRTAQAPNRRSLPFGQERAAHAAAALALYETPTLAAGDPSRAAASVSANRRRTSAAAAARRSQAYASGMPAAASPRPTSSPRSTSRAGETGERASSP